MITYRYSVFTVGEMLPDYVNIDCTANTQMLAQYRSVFKKTIYFDTFCTMYSIS